MSRIDNRIIKIVSEEIGITGSAIFINTEITQRILSIMLKDCEHGQKIVYGAQLVQKWDE